MDKSLRLDQVVETTMYTVTSDTGVDSAKRLARDEKVRHLIVLDHGLLAGVVSRGDLSRGRRDWMITDVMRQPVLCAAPEYTVDEALRIMEQNAVPYLPVVDGGYLRGFVTREMLLGQEETLRELTTTDPN